MKMYSLYLQEPLLNAFRTVSKKTGTSASELMRTAMQEFIAKCLTLGLLSEEEAKDIYMSRPERLTPLTATDAIYPTFPE